MIARQSLVLSALFLVCALGGFLTARAWPPPAATGAQSLDPTHPVAALSRWLQLPAERAGELAAIDPAFGRERADLEAELAAARERLAELFEDPQAADGVIREQLERVIAIHDRLERRVAEYLLAIRPFLDESRRAALFTQCARSIREAGGWRWRHGAGSRGGGPPTERVPGRRRGQGPPWSSPDEPAQTQPASDQGAEP